VRRKLYAVALFAVAAGVLGFGAPAQAADPAIPAPISAPSECKGVAPLIGSVAPVQAKPSADRCTLGAAHSVGLATAGLIAGAATGTAKGLGK
jgi:hypothetical protein